MTLTDFLLARIAEDEAVASKAYPSGPGDGEMHTSWVCNEFMHVAIGDDRMLAECEAKRRIVELHQDFYDSPYAPKSDFGPECKMCGAAGEYGVDWPCPTVKAITLPYADHPDYREEWRP